MVQDTFMAKVINQIVRNDPCILDTVVARHKSDVKPGCLFCGRNHFARSCNVVTKLDIHKNILFKEKQCFKCFKIGHTASTCRSEIRCFKSFIDLYSHKDRYVTSRE